MIKKNEGKFGGGGDWKTPVNTACPENWKVNVIVKIIHVVLIHTLRTSWTEPS